MNFNLYLFIVVALLLSACGSPAPVNPSNQNPNLESLERGSYVAQTEGTCQVTGEKVPVTVRVGGLEQQSSGEYTFKLLLDFGIKTDFRSNDFQDVTLKASAKGYEGDIIFSQYGNQFDKGNFTLIPGEKDGEGYPTFQVTLNAQFTTQCYDSSAPSLESFRPLNIMATFRKIRPGESFPNQAPQLQ